MKPSTHPKYRVTPFNVRTGAKAPSFITEPDVKAKMDEVKKQASSDFSERSALSNYPNWDLDIEKI